MRLTRLLRNPAVTVEEMAATAQERTAERCIGRPVLAIQDTTSIKSSGGGGLMLHAMIAVDAEDGAILGLAHAQFMSRDKGLRGERKSRPLAAKESRRWLEGGEDAARIGALARSVTVIADREGDIFEAFARRPKDIELLVRAAQDRSLGDGGLLFATVDALPEAGRTLLDLPAKPGRKARQARLAVRFMAAQLARPKAGTPGLEALPASVGMTLVDIREVDPPAGEPAVHWRLLISRAVRDITEALAVAELYRRRWAIEQLFRTLKTQGYDIEGLRIAEDVPRLKLVMAALVAAVSVQQLVHARDGASPQTPLRPLTDAFQPEDQPLLEALSAKLEGKTQRQKNPHPKGSLAFAAWVCARLGGWTGYYGKPGPMVMLQGWLSFYDAKQGWDALAQAKDV
ncbi:IS4 family transposase [Phreatobacter stygius]|uniref:IS4 family transposase n=1 Tax=Phreatobacter stygius TaxID=1940610 RepID=A0A4D7AQI9_9HYPH|nr:IS4 family transposase [Phreatobacter stygius]QCI63219.1 IS4 family transposase [Phreatobacter stygius]QCI63249.1 IS4 family transposase [Phreatobacter stygius]QCI65285.1 IS4 family transposase [Phreatobacter stygius]QCI67250.1 IS4 family transposase [Phreatobacter stygius]QCI67293.1 IS4 family transposase [Phreatobacter stygius]